MFKEFGRISLHKECLRESSAVPQTWSLITTLLCNIHDRMVRKQDSSKIPQVVELPGMTAVKLVTSSTHLECEKA